MGVTYLQQIAITIFLIILSIVKINFAQLVSDANIIANINGRSDALPSLSNYISQDNDNLSAGGNIVASINGLSRTDTSLFKSSAIDGEKTKAKAHTAATGNIVARIDGKNRQQKSKVIENNKKGTATYKVVGHHKKNDHKKKNKNKKHKKDKKGKKSKYHTVSITSTDIGLSSISPSNGSPGSLTLQLDIEKLEEDGLSTTDSQISLKNSKKPSLSSWSSSASSNAPVGTSSTTGSSTKKAVSHLSSISSLPSNLTLTNELKDSSLSMSMTSSLSRDQAIFLSKSSLTPTLINNSKAKNGHYADPKLQKVHPKHDDFRSIDKAVNDHSKHQNIIHIQVPITKHKPVNVIGVKNNHSHGEEKLFGHIIKLPAITLHDISSNKMFNSSFFSIPEWSNFNDRIHPGVLSPKISNQFYQELKTHHKKTVKSSKQTQSKTISSNSNTNGMTPMNNKTISVKMNSSLHENIAPSSALYISHIYLPKELLPNGVTAEENNFFALNDLYLPGTHTIPTPVNIGNTKKIKYELKKLRAKLLNNKKLTKIINASSQQILNELPTMAAIKNSTSKSKNSKKSTEKLLHSLQRPKIPTFVPIINATINQSAKTNEAKKHVQTKHSEIMNSGKKPTLKTSNASTIHIVKKPKIQKHSSKKDSNQNPEVKKLHASKSNTHKKHPAAKRHPIKKRKTKPSVVKKRNNITVPIVANKIATNQNATDINLPVEAKNSAPKNDTVAVPTIPVNKKSSTKKIQPLKLPNTNRKKRHHNKSTVKALKKISSSSSTPTLLFTDKKAANKPKLSHKNNRKHHHNTNIVKALKQNSASSSTPTLVLGTSSTLGFPISYDLISTVPASEKNKNDTSFMKLNGIPAFIEQDNLSQGSASGNIRGSIDSSTITVSNAGIHISISSGVIDCDGFVCPPTSYKCAVIEKSGVIPHWHSSYSTLSLSDTVRLNDKIITTRSCSDSMGNVLTSQTTYNLNPNPYHVVKTYSSANKKGFIKQCGNCLTSAEAHTPRPDRKTKRKSRRRKVIPYSSLTPLPTTTSYTSSASSSSPTAASSSSSSTYTQPVPYTSTLSFTPTALPSQYTNNNGATILPTKSVNTVYAPPTTNSFWQEMGGDSNTFV